MGLSDLVLQYGSLAGVAAFVSALINVGKALNVVQDGQAPMYSLVLNVVGFAGFALLGVFAPTIEVAGINTAAGAIAQAALYILGLVLQLGTSRSAHENILKGTKFIGTSHSK